MKTVTLDILNDKALNLLKDLEVLNIIRLRKPDNSVSIKSKKEISFTVLDTNVKDFRFNRDEANER